MCDGIVTAIFRIFENAELDDDHDHCTITKDFVNHTQTHNSTQQIQRILYILNWRYEKKLKKSTEEQKQIKSMENITATTTTWTDPCVEAWLLSGRLF